MSRLTEERILIKDQTLAVEVMGEGESNLRLLEEAFPAKIISRGLDIIIRGDEENVNRIYEILIDIIEVANTRGFIGRDEVYSTIKMVSGDYSTSVAALLLDGIPVPYKRRIIRPKTHGQKKYIKSIKENILTFCIGPAGTGKTYLAMALAVYYLTKGEVNRMILVRPAIEAGEHLGFLPGDFKEKVSPYLRPLYDALSDMMGFDQIKRDLERGTIEVAPLAYMRGRTLNNAFVVMDEAQNTTSEQMKMFLTRLGFNSKVVVTGDITQIDLPKDKPSGLIEVQAFLKNIGGISFIYLTEKDVVRHHLVQSIVSAYDRHEREKKDRPQRLRESKTNGE
ncbi:MAG: PhoH family protein [bacterium]